MTSLKLQQDVTLGGKKYPLSELKPSDDLVVRSINILIERLRANGIKAYAINVLFNLTEDEMNRINALDRNEKHDWY